MHAPLTHVQLPNHQNKTHQFWQFLGTSDIFSYLKSGSNTQSCFTCTLYANCMTKLFRLISRRSNGAELTLTFVIIIIIFFTSNIPLKLAEISIKLTGITHQLLENNLGMIFLREIQYPRALLLSRFHCSIPCLIAWVRMRSRDVSNYWRLV